MTKPRRLQVFAVEPDTVQLTWAALGPGVVVVRAGDVMLEIEADGGPGAVLLTDLAPDTEHRIEVGRHRLVARTLAPPPGRELFRFMTLSDLHLGLDHFGFFQGMSEEDPEELHTLRCTRAALEEGVAWGAQHLVLKGDLVNKATADEYDLVGKVLAEAGLPADGVPGNHEVKSYREVDHHTAYARLGLDAPGDGLRTIDLPGLRVALIDSTTVDHHAGRLDHVTPRLADAIDGRPALVVLHHHLLRLPFSTYWPPGIPSPVGERFLAALAEATPAAIVASGHTHRHRMRRVGNIVVAETGSPKDHPGTWTGYVVHEGGIRQVVRRVSRPDCIAWTEYCRRAVLGAWGLWSPGTLAQRCFGLDWPQPSRSGP